MLEREQLGKEGYLLQEGVRKFVETILWHRDIKLYNFILEIIEKPLIEKVLERTYGNQLKAAKILGINRNTLHSKVIKLGIDSKKWKII